MALVSTSLTFDHGPDQVWAAIRDVGSIAHWFPAFTESWMEGEGNTTRIGVLGDGSRVVERIESIDDQARRLIYRIDESPLPMSSYQSTMTVTEAGTGSQVDWRTEFEPAGITEGELHDMLKGLYDEGLTGLKAQLGG